MSFASKLRELRTETGLTQEALARAAGLSLGVIRDYEQGNREPSLRSAFKLAAALGVAVDVFRVAVESTEEVGAGPKPRGRPKKADQSPTAESKKGTRKKGG